MTSDQKAVAIGAASGIAAMILSLWALYAVLPDPAVFSLAERIAYALKWDALAAVPLVVMLAAVGNARFLGEAIDPTLGKEDPKTLINGRVADNTLQQFLLFLVGSLALAAAVEGPKVKIIGAAAITFVVMRTAFWVGYRIKPVHRAFGFASTFYMNLGLLAGALWLGFR
jgi:MAPEG family